MRPTGSGQTWRGQTTRTLSLVLSGADRKPQRVAAVVVCAAAAAVIFIVGRSPVSGTATIEQSRGTLSPESAPALSAENPPAQTPNSRDEASGTSGDTATSAQSPAGSVVPTGEAQTVSGAAASGPADTRGTSAASGTARTPATSGTGSTPAEFRPRPPAPTPPAQPAAKPRTEIKAPIKRNPEPTPPGGKGGEFDFGI